MASWNENPHVNSPRAQPDSDLTTPTITTGTSLQQLITHSTAKCFHGENTHLELINQDQAIFRQLWAHSQALHWAMAFHWSNYCKCRVHWSYMMYMSSWVKNRTSYGLPPLPLYVCTLAREGKNNKCSTTNRMLFWCKQHTSATIYAFSALTDLYINTEVLTDIISA